MHEGPTENRLGELGSLYKYYYYYYYYFRTQTAKDAKQPYGRVRLASYTKPPLRKNRLFCSQFRTMNAD